MTLDQRIEALTQSLELMAHMQRDAETKHDKITAETDVRLHNITRVLDELTSMMRELIVARATMKTA